MHQTLSEVGATRQLAARALSIDYDALDRPTMIELKDGRKLDTVEDYRKGSPRNPATKAEFAGKVKSLAATVLTPKQTDKLIETVETLESLDDVSRLAQLLVRRSEAA